MNYASIIIPVHNRKETTLRCLNHLKELGIFSWADVIVVDDGSADGTSIAITSIYPAAILLKGDGNLWWAGAINLGMHYVHEHQYSAFFWLNDDCQPKAGTLDRMFKHVQKMGEIASALSITPSGYSYGGFRKTLWGLKRIHAGPCDTFSGNCVAFPIRVIQDIGYLDAKHFPMDPADADYGLRATEKGCRASVLDGAVCDSANNLSVGKSSWLFSKTPLSVYVGNFFKNRNHCSYIPTKFRFSIRHWGVAGFLSAIGFYLRFILYSFIRIIVPEKFLSQFSARSAVWRKTLADQ